MENKVKNTKTKKNTGVKRILILLVIIAIVICVLKYVSNKKDDSNKSIELETIRLSEFEKIALYNYIENNFLDYNLIIRLRNNFEESKIDNEHKVEYVIAYTMKKNNSEIATQIDVMDNYMQLFGENMDETYNRDYMEYSYNLEKKQYEIKKELPVDLMSNSNYKMKINEILKKEDDERIIKLNILEPRDINEVINYYVSDSQRMENNQEIISKLEEYRMKTISNGMINDDETNNYLMSIITDENEGEITSKIKEAELTLKCKNNRFVIINYTENDLNV